MKIIMNHTKPVIVACLILIEAIKKKTQSNVHESKSLFDFIIQLNFLS